MYEEIAAKYAPKGIAIKWKRGGKILPAHGVLMHKYMLVPKPVSRDALYVFLHECAHFHLKHFDADQTDDRKLKLAYTGNTAQSLAEQEYEAEQWASHIMQTNGIAVPRGMTRRARLYVYSCLTQDEAHKTETRKHVRDWVFK